MKHAVWPNAAIRLSAASDDGFPACRQKANEEDEETKKLKHSICNVTHKSTI